MANDSTSIESNSELQKISQVIGSGFNGSWEEKWQQGLTPWDLGKATPIIEHLHQAGALPNGRTLIPGCGRGYDVVAIACPERFVVGLDISDSAIKKAKEADFFTWNPTELFDLIIDYTFFCAIEPDMRPAWASRMQQLLKPDGELLTLMFPISDHTGGPPYKVSIADYEKVLHPMRFKAVSIVDNEMAIGSRKGREKLGRWKRSDEPLLTRSIRESWELLSIVDCPIDKPFYCFFSFGFLIHNGAWHTSVFAYILNKI